MKCPTKLASKETPTKKCENFVKLISIEKSSNRRRKRVRRLKVKAINKLLKKLIVFTYKI